MYRVIMSNSLHNFNKELDICKFVRDNEVQLESDINYYLIHKGSSDLLRQYNEMLLGEFSNCIKNNHILKIKRSYKIVTDVIVQPKPYSIDPDIPEDTWNWRSQDIEEVTQIRFKSLPIKYVEANSIPMEDLYNEISVLGYKQKLYPQTLDEFTSYFPILI